MEWVVQRLYFKENYTIGNFYVNGKFLCNTLEDKNRDLNKNGKFDNGEVKVYGKTAIPFGRYLVTKQWWDKHKAYYPLLNKVPNFSGIFIHGGVTADDSLGCILVGDNKIKGKLLNSAKYMQQLRTLMTQAENRNEKIWITIK